jgi:hypothetical protein
MHDRPAPPGPCTGGCARSPPANPRGCCSYYGQDWGFASETAIRQLAIAHRDGLAGGAAAADRVSDPLPSGDNEVIVMS